MTWHRPSLEEAFAITALPTSEDNKNERYISHYPPWKLGIELPIPAPTFGAFGGTVYGQAALAAARAHRKTAGQDGFMGIFVSIEINVHVNSSLPRIVYPRCFH